MKSLAILTIILFFWPPASPLPTDTLPGPGRTAEMRRWEDGVEGDRLAPAGMKFPTQSQRMYELCAKEQETSA